MFAFLASTVAPATVVPTSPTVMVLISVVGILLTALVGIGTAVSRGNSVMLRELVKQGNAQGKDIVALQTQMADIARRLDENDREHGQLWNAVNDAKRLRGSGL